MSLRPKISWDAWVLEISFLLRYQFRISDNIVFFPCWLVFRMAPRERHRRDVTPMEVKTLVKLFKTFAVFIKGSIFCMKKSKLVYFLKSRPPKVLLEYYPMKLVGHDKFYNPIWIKGFGQGDWRGLLQSTNKRDFMRYVCYISELASEEFRKCSELATRPITTSTFIIDMEGLSMKQITYKPCEPN